MTKYSINDLRVRKDGDQFYVILPDFVDLQQSPVLWIPVDSYLGQQIAPWMGVSANPLYHVPVIELLSMLRRLEAVSTRPAPCSRGEATR